MVKRGAVVVMSEEEVSSWEGSYYYLPHLIALNPKKNTPARLCFDASRRQGGRSSLNDCLYKGPDRYMNNLVVVILGFRWGRVGLLGDIKKFHNTVYLDEKDVHMQRFLWRNLKQDQKPKVYAVAVNNMGVVCANCVASTALYTSADMHKEVYPEAAVDLQDQTYGDDILSAADTIEEATERT